MTEAEGVNEVFASSAPADDELRAVGAAVMGAASVLAEADTPALPPELAVLDESIARREALAVELAVALPEGVTFGQLLSLSAPPDLEHVFRAAHGLYPYTQKLDALALAGRFGLSEASSASIVDNLHPRIRALAADTRVPPENKPVYGLEEVARQMHLRPDMSPEDLLLICALRGLPPYMMPIARSELAFQRQVNQSELGRQEQSILADLMGVGAPAAPDIVLPAVQANAEHQRAARELGLMLPPDLSLAELLTYASLEEEHLVRELCGLFPYSAPAGSVALARKHNTQPENIEGRLERIIDNLSYLASHWPEHRAPARGLTLEELFERLQTADFPGTDRTIIAALYGLPPYAQPLFQTVAARQFGVSRWKIRDRETRILQALGGVRPHRFVVPEADRGYRKRPGQFRHQNEDLVQLSRRIEAGMYAAGLLALNLRAPHTHEQALINLQRQVRWAAHWRKSRREGSLRKWKGWMGRTYTDEGPEVSSQDLIARARQYDPERDSPEGQKALMARLVARARAFTPKEAMELAAVVKDGQDAEAIFVADHQLLVMFVATHTWGNFQTNFANGNVGLLRAVRKFDPRFGYRFSGYAVPWIAQAIQRGRWREVGIPPSLGSAYDTMRGARSELLKVLREKPTTAQLAAATGLDEGLLDRLQTLERQKEEVSLTATGGDRLEPGAPLVDRLDVPAPEPPDENLRTRMHRAFERAFEVAELSDEQRRLMRAFYFGVPPHGQAMDADEVATLFGTTATSARKRRGGAEAKLRASQAASEILDVFFHSIPKGEQIED